MRLVFLGTGGGWPSKDTGVSSIAMRVPYRVYLFDCGEGTQRQIMYSSVSFMDISHIFLSHFHGDHFLGLPGLIQSMALNDRSEKLVVVGPEGVKDLVDTLLSLGYFTQTFPVEALEALPGVPICEREMTIIPFEGDHTVPSLGYMVQEPDRPGRFDKEAALALEVPEGPLFSRLQRGEDVVVGERTISSSMVVGPPRRGRKVIVTGDTRPLDPVPEIWVDCDALIHDSTFAGNESERALRYGHSTSMHAAVAAKNCGARRLYLVHRSPRYQGVEEILEGVREIFPESYAPRDLEEVDVPLPCDDCISE